MSSGAAMEDEQVGAQVEALASLDARSWARLLVVLRDVEGVGVRTATMLAQPASELASGTARRDLCEQVVPDGPLRDALLASDATPPLVRQALTRRVATDGGVSRRAGDVTGDVIGPAHDARTDPQANGRERELRRELATLRRQRDGAEARAVAAGSRAEDRAAAAELAQVRIAALEAQLLAAANELAQAVARAERRSDARVVALEAELAGARSELERTSRRAERDAAALRALRDDHAEASAELASLRAAQVPAEAEAGAGERPVRLPSGIHPDTTEAARWLLATVRTLLVDGYNVSLNLRAGQELDAQRRWLIERVRPLAARGPIAPVIVFDGGQPAPSSSMSAGVEVRFTAQASTADDDIVFTVAVTTGPVLVVTDDRELRERVTAEGANVIGGRAFLGALDQ